MSKVDIVIIGAGISGATLAERYASLGKKVLVIERRDHIGGNCFDFVNEVGILVAKYGAHIFHTNNEEVWQYVQNFSEWMPYEHKVLSLVEGKLVPVPVNITTVNKVLGLRIKTEKQMLAWLKKNQIPFPIPKNSEETALSRVGKVLYEKMFKNYTKKQWEKYPAQLDALVLKRIPVRTTFDDRYFSDTYQALPKYGYTKLFEKMLSNPNITVKLNTDYFDIKSSLKGYKKLFYTGPIDRFFEFKHSLGNSLEYRTINFEWETLNQEQFQPTAVVNYPSESDGAFTRIVEHKHFGNQKNAKTTITREYSVDHIDGKTEPYYPVPTPKNQALFKKYQKETEGLTDIYFVGRLANYKYFNMDEAFKNALDLFNSLQNQKTTI